MAVDRDFEMQVEGIRVKVKGPLGIACRKCAAQPGELCISRDSEVGMKPQYRSDFHGQRIQDALELQGLTGGECAITDEMIDATGLV